MAKPCLTISAEMSRPSGKKHFATVRPCASVAEISARKVWPLHRDTNAHLAFLPYTSIDKEMVSTFSGAVGRR